MATVTVNNGTLTIQKNGTTVATFTANASSGVTANLVVPTKISDLVNDSGFVTSAVTSFNGQVGAVTYSAPVTSVNGQTGAITVNGMSDAYKTKVDTLYEDYLGAITAIGV